VSTEKTDNSYLGCQFNQKKEEGEKEESSEKSQLTILLASRQMVMKYKSKLGIHYTHLLSTNSNQLRPISHPANYEQVEVFS